MNKYSYNYGSSDPAQTQHLAMRLGELLLGGELILLAGQLGAGKTTFTQGLAQGLQITDMVSSPTFTLLKEYKANPEACLSAVQEKRLSTLERSETRSYGPALARVRRMGDGVRKLYHFDLYRLDDPDELLALGFDEYFDRPDPTAVCLVEWADKADAFWPAERLSIHLRILDETKRNLSFTATGTHYCELLQKLADEQT